MTPVQNGESVRLPSAAIVATYAAVAAVFASAMPLLAYAGSLAVFGLAHVVTELRYVDGRFGRRLRSGTGVAILSILTVVVGLRALSLLGGIDPFGEYIVELGLVAVLAFVVVPNLAARPARAALAVAVGAAIATGSALAPWTTVVILSILHNATPVGFLAERLARSPRRRAVMQACAVLFVLCPVAIATGFVTKGLGAIGLRPSEVSFPSAGVLVDHLRVFVPPALTDASFAPSLFAASAYLQLLHYGIVIGVLPRLLGVRGTPSDAPVAPWPRRSVLTAGIGVVGLFAAIAFVRDFSGTRAAYGLVASFHAWIELPVLLLALSPVTREAIT